ncbi:hypothetical protein TREAZ_0426 [Leadbettera azotonutricia ZAS-9]|uniref:Uncharacterized protein n=1 Tax=Leadbettera azotonutricia (strain ATCC BAA-888 / DSM 13862 / ZAS-9) TaxID=545695 RepID=F5YCU8_LEAAZ|nr:hypothetical protein TREAZ_0426 [Leadbettera azotonutricia ZAS-9]
MDLSSKTGASFVCKGMRHLALGANGNKLTIPIGYAIN